MFCGFIDDLGKPERSMALVFAERGLAENLSQLAAHIAAQQIHLPETIGRGDISLRKIQVVVVRRFDIRDAAFVAADRDAIVQSGDGYGGGCLLSDCRGRPSVSGKYTTEDDNQQEYPGKSVH